MAREFTIDREKIAEYAADTGKMADAVESLFKHDGWQIFRALFERQKREIKDKDDYDSLEAFKADRKAIEIVEGILEEMNLFVKDGEDMQKLLNSLTPPEDATPRGILSVDMMGGEESREA